MAICIQLFGGFRVSSSEDLALLRGSPERRLLALLCFHPNQALTRRDIAAKLWPEVSYEVSSNRLRTALVALKRGFAPHEIVAAAPSELQLKSNLIECDLWELWSLEDELTFSPDLDEEASQLERYLALIMPGLLPEWEDDEWLIEHKREWRLKTIDALQRLANIAFRKQQHERTVDIAQQITNLEPTNNLGWSLYLRAMSQLGKAEEAVRRFNAVKTSLPRSEWSSQVINLAKAARNGQLAAKDDLVEFKPDENEFLMKVLRRVLTANGDLAAQFLSSNEFYSEVNHQPPVALKLLQGLSDFYEANDLSLNAIHFPMMVSTYTLNLRNETLHYGQWVLDNSSVISQKRRAAMAMSFSHFTVREWDKAFEYGYLAIQLAEEENPLNLAIAKSQIASYEWHLGNFDKALEIYYESLSTMDKCNEPAFTYSRGALVFNIGISTVLKGDLDKGFNWYQENKATLFAIPIVEGSASAVMAYLHAERGEFEQAVRLLRNGLILTWRTQHRRFFEITLDFAAAVLARMGHPAEALGLLDALTRFRSEHGHIRSVAEEGLANKIRQICDGIKPNPEWLAFESLKQSYSEVMKLLKDNP